MSFYYVLLLIITKLFPSHKNIETISLLFFVTECFAADKYVYELLKYLSPTQSKHLKIGLYQGSDDHCVVDHESDLNYLASVILRQYTTVTNHC